MFHTDSDTEVVLASFAEWGEKCLHKFNGMWAFAIWNHTKQQLFLARDRFGKKPLFYSFVKDDNGGEKLVFASEMKAIYPFLQEVKPSKKFHTLSNIVHIFDYEHTSDTLIDGIYRFPYAHYAFYSLGDMHIKPIRYYTILDYLITPIPSYQESVEKFRALFLDSVKLRMRSDVSIGTALSGGLDSSATICAMAYLGKNDVRKDWQHAVVACFKDTPLDESGYAKKVVDHIGIKGIFVEIEPIKHWDKIYEYFYLFEDLYITSPVPMIAAYGAIKQKGVSVTLDGHGADELFSGYGHLIEALWDSKFNPAMAFDVLTTLNQTRMPTSSAFALGKEAFMYYVKKTIKHLIKYKMPISQDSNHPNFQGLDYFSQQLYLIFSETILPTLLRNYDRYSMINSVEIRMPFMDHRLVEFVFSLPFSYKLGKGYTKKLIRDALCPFMPPEVVWRKSKIGFNSPIIQWIQRNKAQGGLREWFLDTTHSKDFVECPLIENAVEIQNTVAHIIQSQKDTFNVGEHLWCKINPYLWYKSLDHAVSF
ncbi:asparagine synthase (glutamine-hydrolyzing) [Helicobacter labetoulli]